VFSVRGLCGGYITRISPEAQFFSSSAVELRGQFKAVERLVRSAVQLWLLHGSREDYKSSEDNGLTDRIQQQSSGGYKRRLELKCWRFYFTCFFIFGATAPIWALTYLHETLRFTSGVQHVVRPLSVHKHRKTHIHTETLNIHALSVIRTHYFGFRASE
jgi:hypothetical protein